MKIELTGMSLKGDAIGIVTDTSGNRRQVYAPFGCPGDIIEYRSPSSTNHPEQFSLVTPSLNRVSPECGHFGVCGGCTYQHIAYDTQTSLKHRQLQDIYDKILPKTNISFVPSDLRYRYRNRITLQSHGSAIGFSSRGSHTVFNLKECRIASERVEQKALELVESGIPPGYYGVCVYEDGDDMQTFYLKNQADSPSFIQINGGINTKIINSIRARLKKIGAGSRILDLYCGNGNFSFPLFDIAQEVIGIDSSYLSIARAKEKSSSLGLEHFHFYEIPVENAHSHIRTYSKTTDCMILDPPRRGLRKDASFLAALHIPLVLYVSCNPLTLRTDILEFIKTGYHIETLTGFDMFPQTPHIESLCVLKR
ncbi:MAG: class I SAM-dependent RNA methyltransferase [Spirochaetales bacterium]|nr:class I SAM-dependent RNA methyltransferase [Spirochaetales bacterium]